MEPFTLGSPPHTREQRGKLILAQCHTGITPAYAGTAAHKGYTFWEKEDHPRIRGNSFGMTMNVLCGMGSPPHTREQLNNLAADDRHLRITPAYAGTAFSFPAAQSRHRITPAYAGTAR